VHARHAHEVALGVGASARLDAVAKTLPRPEDVAERRPPSWQGFVMKGTAGVLWTVILASLLFIAWNTFVIANIVGTFKPHSPMYSWAGMNILSGTMLRTLAIFFGAAVMFAGAATAFYTIGQSINVSGEKGSGADALKFAVATASPGVIAVLAGAFVISVAVLSKIESQLSGQPGQETFNMGLVQSSPAAIPTAAEVLKQAEDASRANGKQDAGKAQPEPPKK
jgi:hypothetical protein